MTKLIILLWVLLFALVACQENTPTSTPAAQLTPEEQRGAELFRIYCATCHDLGTRVLVGPPLGNIATLAQNRVAEQSARDYLHTSILQPDVFIVSGFAAGSMQQNFGDQLSDEEVNFLVAFLLTLR